MFEIHKKIIRIIPQFFLKSAKDLCFLLLINMSNITSHLFLWAVAEIKVIIIFFSTDLAWFRKLQVIFLSYVVRKVLGCYHHLT